MTGSAGKKRVSASSVSVGARINVNLLSKSYWIRLINVSYSTLKIKTWNTRK